MSVRAPEVPTSRHAVVSATMRAEWSKLVSLRSSAYTLAASFAALLGIAALICSFDVSSYDRDGLFAATAFRTLFDPVFSSVSGIFLAQLGLGVLGVLTMSSEYSTGMIRTSLAAVPNRLILYGAKIVVHLVVALVVGTIGSVLAFEIGQAVLGPAHLSTSLASPGVLRGVLGGGGYLGVLTLLGTGLGALLRRTAGAIAALFGLLLVLPAIAAALPSPWGPDVARYLPSEAGSDLLHVNPLSSPPGSLSPWAGFAVFGAYALAALVAGGVALVRRDA